MASVSSLNMYSYYEYGYYEYGYMYVYFYGSALLVTHISRDTITLEQCEIARVTLTTHYFLSCFRGVTHILSERGQHVTFLFPNVDCIVG